MYLIRLLIQYMEENYFSAALDTEYKNLPYTATATTLLMLVGGLALGILIAVFVIVIQKKLTGKLILGLLDKEAHSAESAQSLADLGLEKSGMIKYELSHLSVSRKLIAIVNEDGSVTTYRDELIRAFPEFAQEAAEREEAEAPLTEESTQADIDTSEEGPQLIPTADMEKEESEDKEGKLTRAKKKTKSFLFEKKFKPSKPNFESARFFIPEELIARASIRFRKKGGSVRFLILTTVVVIALFFAALSLIPPFVGLLDASIGNIKGV